MTLQVSKLFFEEIHMQWSLFVYLLLIPVIKRLPCTTLDETILYHVVFFNRSVMVVRNCISDPHGGGWVIFQTELQYGAGY